MAGTTPRYGRALEEIEVGASYAHPWDVTIDSGMVALFRAAFLDATPTYASLPVARSLGLPDRPLPPLLLLNLGLAFSVHDVSERAIAHLAYLDVRFPNVCYEGDTLVAASRVLGVERSAGADKAVVHVRTIVLSQRDEVVCTFERKALLGARAKVDVASRSRDSATMPRSAAQRALVSLLDSPPRDAARLPAPLRALPIPTERPVAFEGALDAIEPGAILYHDVGRTVGDSEAMQLATLCRNTHPLHVDESYCKAGGSFARTRVVYGGLVLAWVASLASRDTAASAIWELGLEDGAHPNGVVAGDTLYAASKVLDTNEIANGYTELTLRLVGTKNVRPEKLADAGADIFAPERGKTRSDLVEHKVLEITRTLLVRRRAS